MNVNIEHHKENNRFQTTIENRKAYLSYRKQGEGTLEYYKTFVPEQDRDRGIASQLTRAALTYAKNNDLKVIPTCPFVASYIEEHREFEALRADE